MDAIDKLVAAESIRNTKATYWYAMDTKNWDLLRTVFTDDARFDMREEAAFGQGVDPGTLPSFDESVAAGNPSVSVGAKAIVGFIRQVVENWVTVHHGHAPIIKVLSPEHATAIWPLFDYIDDGQRALKGYGHYHEEYRPNAEGEWLISSLRLTRLRADGDYPSMPEF